MTADFGSFGKMVSVGQFVNTYSESEMIGKNIWGITNFSPRRIAGIKSEYLTVGFYNQDNYALTLNSFGATPRPGTLLYRDIPKDESLLFEDFSKLEIIVGRVISVEASREASVFNIDFGTDRGIASIQVRDRLGVEIQDTQGKLVCVYANGEIELEILGYEENSLFYPLGVDEKGCTINLGNNLG